MTRATNGTTDDAYELPARLRYSILGNASTEKSGEKHILFDRNVASDIANLFRDTPIEDEAREISTALILFLRLCKFKPAALPALQEFESQHQGERAYDEVLAFCKALSCHIKPVLSLLNGRTHRLLDTDVPITLRFAPFDMQAYAFRPSSQWILSYAATLKLVALMRDSALSRIEKLDVFLLWIHENFFFAPPLLFVASQFFCPAGRKSIIKRAMTSDRQKLGAEVRNAAWDLNILLEWHIVTKRASKK